MRIQNTDFRLGQEKSLKVVSEVTLDIGTALRSVQDVNFKNLLNNANRLVNKANAEIKGTLDTGKVQLQLDKFDFISNEDGFTLPEKRLAMNIIRLGKKAYSFHMLNVKELKFVCIEKGKIKVLYLEYRIVPNGHDNEGNITFTNEENFAHVLHVQDIDLTGQKYVEVNSVSLKKAVLNDTDGLKLAKLKELFDKESSLLDKNNIRTIEKDCVKSLEVKTLELIEKINSEVMALEILAKNKELRELNI